MITPGAHQRPEQDEIARARLALLVAYFQSARDELNSRIGHRDNALLLFLGASTAVFGVAFGQVERPALLFAVAPLGLGASLVVSQHNDVIGGLHDYCGMEVTMQAEEMFGASMPDSSNTSISLLGIDPRGMQIPRLRRADPLSRFFRDRLYASLVLILGPAMSGAVLGFANTHNTLARCLGLLIDSLAVVWGGFLLWASYNERNRRQRKLLEWRKARTSDVG